MKRTMQYVMIVLFAVILIAPLAFLNRDSEKVSFLENKRVEQFPELFLEEEKLNGEFTYEFEEYWNDNVGFRDEAIVANIALTYKCFGKLAIPNFFMGTEEELFYSLDKREIVQYQGTNPVSETDLEITMQSIVNANNYFTSIGSEFIMVTVPDKESVYPEYYPKTIIQRSDVTEMESIVAYTKAHSDVNITHLEEALKAEKQEGVPLYYRSYDCTHWNANGSFIGYQEMMGLCRESYPDLLVLEKEDFEIVSMPTKGTLIQLESYQILCDTMGFDDTYYDYRKKEDYSTLIEGDYPMGGIDLSLVGNNGRSMHFVNPQKPEAPKIMIIGDSYVANNMLLIFAESFSEVYFFNSSYPEVIEQAAEFYQPDIVLYEIVERAYWSDGFPVLAQLGAEK